MSDREGKGKDPAMTLDDQDLMAAVWADPDCPVELASEGNRWPRERARSVFKGEPWTFSCRCRHRQPPVVRMQGRLWLVNKPGQERSVLVYLGQCGDCGSPMKWMPKNDMDGWLCGNCGAFRRGAKP